MSEEKPKRKRGRPKGSKNKPKTTKVEDIDPQFERMLDEPKPKKQIEKESKNSDEMIAWCGACKSEITGKSNWIRHLQSQEHLTNVEKFSKPIPQDTNQIKQSIQTKSLNNGLIAGLIIAVGVAMFFVGITASNFQPIRGMRAKIFSSWRPPPRG